MKALNIALKDIQIFLKDRGAIINLFLLPMVFILVLSTAMQGLMGGGEDDLITLPAVNLDPGGEAAQALIDALNEAGGIEVKLYDQTEAQALLEDLEIERVLTIPANFTAVIAADRPATLHLVNHPDASGTTNESVLRVVNGVARGMSLQTQLIASFEQMGAMLGTSPSEFQVFTTERIVAQAQSQFESSKTAPLVAVEQTRPDNLSEQFVEPNAVQQNVPGLTILFVFLAAQATAYSIYREKQVGSFRRLMAAPISKAAMLVGKMIPNFITGLIQIVVIFAISIFVLPLLGLDQMTLGNDPLALVLVSLLLVLCSTGLGILIAAIARTEAQIGGLATLVMWTMGAVGGCLFPPFLLGGLLDIVGKVVPHYWAIQAYQDLIVRGQGLTDVATELLALLGFSLVFFGIGLWRFDFD
jgi:ABC-2 type transport system permease protein